MPSPACTAMTLTTRPSEKDGDAAISAGRKEPGSSVWGGSQCSVKFLLSVCCMVRSEWSSIHCPTMDGDTCGGISAVSILHNTFINRYMTDVFT